MYNYSSSFWSSIYSKENDVYDSHIVAVVAPWAELHLNSCNDNTRIIDAQLCSMDKDRAADESTDTREPHIKKKKKNIKTRECREYV